MYMMPLFNQDYPQSPDKTKRGRVIWRFIVKRTIDLLFVDVFDQVLAQQPKIESRLASARVVLTSLYLYRDELEKCIQDVDTTQVTKTFGSEIVEIAQMALIDQPVIRFAEDKDKLHKRLFDSVADETWMDCYRNEWNKIVLKKYGTLN